MEVTASGIEILAVEGAAAHERLFREVVPTLVRDGKNPGRARRRGVDAALLGKVPDG
jgi:hypothetical protein